MRRAVLAVAVAVCVAGCGGDDGAPPNDPRSCLAAAGVTNVEKHEHGHWFGDHDLAAPGLIEVSREENPAAARAYARAVMMDIYAARVGRYVVFGPAKPSVPGGVDVRDAEEAALLVEEVAACLAG